MTVARSINKAFRSVGRILSKQTDRNSQESDRNRRTSLYSEVTKIPTTKSAVSKIPSKASRKSVISSVGDLPTFGSKKFSPWRPFSKKKEKRPLNFGEESNESGGLAGSGSFLPFVSYDSIEKKPFAWMKHFSFFGHDRDDPAPRIWGQAVRKRHRLKDESTRLIKSNQLKRHSTNAKLMLRDTTVPFSYLDVFESDFDEVKESVISTFSIGAHMLEHIKIFVGIWTILVCTAICAFWGLSAPSAEIIWIDGVVDVMYAIALALELRTTVLDIEIGQERCQPSKILYEHLVNRFFWFDIISLIPIGVIVFLADGAQWARWVVLVKGLRSWRLGREPPRTVFVSSNSFTLFRLVWMLVIGGHLLACIWFYIVYENTSTIRTHYELAADDDPRPYNGFWEYYFQALNNGIYLLLGIERDAKSTIEHAFLTLCVPLGAFVHAYVFGEIVLLIERRGMLDTIENEQTLAVQQAMRLLGLSPALQLRIISYFTYERLRRNSRSCDIMLRRLSPQLRYEIHLCLYTDLVSDTSLFQSSRPRVIRDIVTTLKDIVFLPGDNICRYGEHGDSMYFIIDGSVTILGSDNEIQIGSLGAGAYFGEVALLTGVRRTAYVRAETFCLLAQLTKHDFEPIIRTYPEEVDTLMNRMGHLKDNDKELSKIRQETLRFYGINGKRRDSHRADSHMGDLKGANPPEGFNSATASSRSILMRNSKGEPELPDMPMSSRISLTSENKASAFDVNMRHALEKQLSLNPGLPGDKTGQLLRKTEPYQPTTKLRTSWQSSEVESKVPPIKKSLPEAGVLQVSSPGSTQDSSPEGSIEIKSQGSKETMPEAAKPTEKGTAMAGAELTGKDNEHGSDSISSIEEIEESIEVKEIKERLSQSEKRLSQSEKRLSQAESASATQGAEQKVTNRRGSIGQILGAKMRRSIEGGAALLGMSRSSTKDSRESRSSLTKDSRSSLTKQRNSLGLSSLPTKQTSKSSLHRGSLPLSISGYGADPAQGSNSEVHALSHAEIEARVVKNIEKIEVACDAMNDAVERVPRATQDQVDMFNSVLADLGQDLFLEFQADLAPLKQQIHEMQAEVVNLSDSLSEGGRRSMNTTNSGRRQVCDSERRRSYGDDDGDLMMMRMKSNVKSSRY